jgi:hypothetical protein
VGESVSQREQIGVPLVCYQVYAWPEFAALCKRLGIDHAALTKSLVIRFEDPDAVVEVTHCYLADDRKSRFDDASTDTPHHASPR